MKPTSLAFFEKTGFKRWFIRYTSIALSTMLTLLFMQYRRSVVSSSSVFVEKVTSGTAH